MLLISLVIAAVFGIVYGFLFIFQHQKLFSNSLHRIMMIGLPALRIFTLGVIFYYLLHLSLIVSILTVATFICSWWAVILALKDRIA